MGFYLRKSFSFGPLRLNLSKSGLGYSFGVKGARIGTGPRGNYIHMGRYGLYYRQYFNSPTSSVSAPSDQNADSPVPVPEGSAVVGTVIPTADVSALKDSSAEELLNYIRSQHAKVAYAPWIAAGAALLVAGMASMQISLWLIAICISLTIGVCWILSQYDAARKRVVLRYQLDASADAKYKALSSGLTALSSCYKVWRIITSDRSFDTKYTAGAGQLISRKYATTSVRVPPYVEVNLSIWSIVLGNQTIYFLPDRILVYQGSQIGSLPYSELSAKHAVMRFVENDGVPSDARTIGFTWQYVNKGGGPDRRFANNRQIPIAEYAEVLLHSNAGLNVILQCSNVPSAKTFADSICAYGSGSFGQTAVPEHPQIEEPDPLPGESAIGSWGWIAVPVLSLAFISAMFFGPREHYLETPNVPVTSSAATERPLPKVRVLRQKGSQISVAVPKDTSDADMRRVIEDLRVKVENGQLSELGLAFPKQTTTSGGTIFLYMTDSVKITAQDKRVATVKWAKNVAGATVLDARGDRMAPPSEQARTMNTTAHR